MMQWKQFSMGFLYFFKKEQNLFLKKKKKFGLKNQKTYGLGFLIKMGFS